MHTSSHTHTHTHTHMNFCMGGCTPISKTHLSVVKASVFVFIHFIYHGLHFWAGKFFSFLERILQVSCLSVCVLVYICACVYSYMYTYICAFMHVFFACAYVCVCGYIYITVNLKSAGARSFQYQAPCVWNSVPIQTRLSPSLTSFKSSLKTHLFRNAFTWVFLKLSP